MTGVLSGAWGAVSTSVAMGFAFNMDWALDLVKTERNVVAVLEGVESSSQSGACFTADTPVAVVGQHMLHIRRVHLWTWVVAPSVLSKPLRRMKQPAYDRMPMTSKTWEKISLRYNDLLAGKRYPVEVELLRPMRWALAYGIRAKGDVVQLSIPDFGIHHQEVVVTAIKPLASFSTLGVHGRHAHSVPVIGRVKRYAVDVNTYAFRDDVNGHVSYLNVTPEHLFYVRNRRAFVPISHVTTHDVLVGANGHGMHLICSPRQHHQCVLKSSYSKKPVVVYNLELYRRHVYQVGTDRILVHNICINQLKHITRQLHPLARQQLSLMQHVVDDRFVQDGAYGFNSTYGRSTFNNYFSRRKWIMALNKRDPSAAFHANDVVREQYLMAAVRGDFLGSVPEIIVRRRVSNPETLEALSLIHI